MCLYAKKHFWHIYFIQSIIARNFLPTISTGWLSSALDNLLYNDLPFSFSFIHSSANFPDCTSFRIFFISFRVPCVIILFPLVRSPYSAVSETLFLMPCIPVV